MAGGGGGARNLDMEHLRWKREAREVFGEVKDAAMAFQPAQTGPERHSFHGLSNQRRKMGFKGEAKRGLKCQTEPDPEKMRYGTQV